MVLTSESKYITVSGPAGILGYAGALQLHGMGRPEPTNRQGRNRKGHPKIPEELPGESGKIAAAKE
jgi:hypothetical protein